jgi:uncharacterized protein (DUF1778 family)
MDLFGDNNPYMARPPKDPSERKTVDVRIPLTEEQKELVSEAASSDGSDVATWLRPIVLSAAEDRIAKKKKK